MFLCTRLYQLLDFSFNILDQSGTVQRSSACFACSKSTCSTLHHDKRHFATQHSNVKKGWFRNSLLASWKTRKTKTRTLRKSRWRFPSITCLNIGYMSTLCTSRCFIISDAFITSLRVTQPQSLHPSVGFQRTVCSQTPKPVVSLN